MREFGCVGPTSFDFDGMNDDFFVTRCCICRAVQIIKNQALQLSEQGYR